jgi:hypothetical protein
MENKQQIRVWTGERKLLPIELLPLGHVPVYYHFRCLLGEGYLRIMSSAQRQLVKQGGEFTIVGGDIATLSGKQTMLVELKD